MLPNAFVHRHLLLSNGHCQTPLSLVKNSLAGISRGGEESRGGFSRHQRTSRDRDSSWSRRSNIRHLDQELSFRGLDINGMSSFDILITMLCVSISGYFLHIRRRSLRKADSHEYISYISFTRKHYPTNVSSIYISRSVSIMTSRHGRRVHGSRKMRPLRETNLKRIHFATGRVQSI